MTERPNVVLIVVDQWRGDALGSAGHPVVQTPHLDRLAQDGIRFSRAYTATPSCIPARAALLTGLDQRHHGRVGYRDGVPWTYPVTLGSVFADAGYHTQVVGKMHVYPARSLMGFHNVVLHDGYLHFDRQRAPALNYNDDYLDELRQRAAIPAIPLRRTPTGPRSVPPPTPTPTQRSATGRRCGRSGRTGTGISRPTSPIG